MLLLRLGLRISSLQSLRIRADVLSGLQDLDKSKVDSSYICHETLTMQSRKFRNQQRNWNYLLHH